jgi:thiamine biosynthesis protein ThiI
MYRIADAVCRERDLSLIVSGESIGQVASQTVESLKVINEVTNLPVIRPLATYDKVEIIKTAREIGTYDISIRPYEDCCTIFVPEHPVIKPDARKVEFQESKFDFSELIKKALQNMESYELDSKTKFSIFEKMKIPGNYEI